MHNSESVLGNEIQKFSGILKSKKKKTLLFLTRPPEQFIVTKKKEKKSNLPNSELL